MEEAKAVYDKARADTETVRDNAETVYNQAVRDNGLTVARADADAVRDKA